MNEIAFDCQQETEVNVCGVEKKRFSTYLTFCSYELIGNYLEVDLVVSGGYW